MAGRGLWACAMALCLLGLVQGKTLQLQEKRRDPAYDQFVLTTGAYKTELETIAYEESLKVTFSYDLPPLLYNSTMPERCLKEDTACQWESQLKAVLNMLRVNSTVAKGQNHAVALGQRRKRAWWSLAAQAIPILVDNFPKLLGLFRKTDATPQKAAVVEYRGMAVPRAGVAEMPKALSALTAHYKQLLTKWQSKQPEDRIEKMRDEVSKQVEGLKILSDGILQLVTLDKVMAVCESSLLPSRLVEWDHLKTAMVAAKTHLEKYNAEPVVTEAQWQLLYKMKTVTCAAVNSKFTVTLLLPIKRRGEEQTVYLLTPVPFRNQETVCYFFESAMTVVVLGTRTFFLPSDYCHPQEIFCHVPRDTNFDNVPNCLTALFPDSEVLTQECNPRCTPLVEPIVTGNGDGRLSVITAPGFPLTVACQNGDLQMPEERIGASQLTLPCDCELRCADKILVQKRLLCDGQKEPISVENLAPVQWLKTKRFAPFLSLIRQTQTVTETDLELTAKQVTKEQEFEFPKWAEDSVIMIGAMILMTLTRVVCSLWKRCLAKRNRSTETIYAQTLEQRGSVASLNT